MRKLVTPAAVLALALGLTACGSGSDSGGSGGGEDALVVGATAVPAGEVLTYIKDNLAEKAGLNLEIKEFTDYVLPNTALQEGTLDANLYQNQPFLDEFNKSKGTNLVPVVKAYLPPMGVYAKTIEGISELADGATVAVPNETTNEGRALKLLAAEGLITLKDGAGANASPADIMANPRHLKFKNWSPPSCHARSTTWTRRSSTTTTPRTRVSAPPRTRSSWSRRRTTPTPTSWPSKRATRTTPGSRSSRSSSSRPT